MSGHDHGGDPFRYLPRFEPLAFLGSGSMGVVYRVRDRETDSEVALKTVAVRSPELLYRLKGEFRILADMAHPNLVELYELVVSDDVCAFTMELVDGADFVRHFRSGGSADLCALAAATEQLIDGLGTLHAAGKLHRDIKPSNVMVAADGRVVLLDFGLAIAFGADAPAHYAGRAGGSLAYMAPEILLGDEPTAESDWYGAGVMLFETIAGDLPFGAASLPADRLSAAARRLRSLHADVPADWDEAVASLLALRPADRRAGVEFLRRAGGGAARGPSAVRALVTGAGAFVGRDSEIQRLHDAFESTRANGATVVHVTGPSGIGKSEFLRRFLFGIEGASAESGWPDVPSTAFRGRCHPQEALRYNAFDGIVDGLSRCLLSMGAAITPLVPADADLLLRLFPVLARVPALEGAPATAEAVEPHDLRRRAFAALREMLRRLATVRRLVLWIDDLQCSDLDSMALLREILRLPDAPPLLVVLSYRDDVEAVRTVLDELQRDAVLPVPERIDLGPLSVQDAAALAHRLGVRSLDSDPGLAELTAEARGNPFLVGELVRSLAGGGVPRVGEVVFDRVRGLAEPARDLLELVSVAGGPLPRDVVLDACGLGERGRALVRSLEKRSLLRTAPTRPRVMVEVYHDRIRDAVLGRLPAERGQLRHAALADVLAARPEPDAEALFRHSLGAGRRERAGEWAVRAADRAAEGLAFQRAAALYGDALDLYVGPLPRWSLLERQAGALANGGHAVDAARAYLRASETIDGDGAESARRVLALRERAATHFLRTGHLDEGFRVARQVMRDVGLPYPRGQARALLLSVGQRLRLGLRGFDFVRRPDPLPLPLQLRLDAAWSISTSLLMMDQPTADALGVRYLLEALDSGDPTNIVHALGGEVMRTAQIGGAFFRRRCRRLFELMKAVQEDINAPFERAFAHCVEGTIAFQTAQWARAQEHCAAAADLLRRDCVGTSWELATIETFGLSALAHLGEFRRLAQRLPEVLADAEARGDLYAALLFRTGVINLVWLARDRPDEALEIAETAMARWPAADTFQVQHYLHLIATAHAELYRGDAWAAFRRVQAAWPRLRAALFLRLEGARVELRNLRARTALAAAQWEPVARGAAPDPTWPRRRLLRLAAREARRIARDSDLASARPLAQLIEAGLADACGREGEALRRLAEAETALTGADMAHYAAAAQLRRGQRLGAGEGRPWNDASAAWGQAQGIERPRRFLRVWLPAIRPEECG